MIPILMYHRVEDIAPGSDLYPGMTMSARLFDAQMAHLAQGGFRCLSLGEVLRCDRGEMEAPPRAVSITFDDGYLDNYTNAWPILEKYGFSATIFLVAEKIGTANDWDSSDAPPPLMSTGEILEMRRAGIEFGSHTLSHASLTSVSDDEMRRQISVSRKRLEDELGESVQFFSYPYDQVDAEVASMVAESGYAGACGTSSLDYGPFNLWRIECLGTDSMAQFRRKASGAYYRWMHLRDRTPAGRFALGLKQAGKRLRPGRRVRG